MADDKHYVPGDFYRICDRTGFKVRAGRTEKQWNNIIVRGQSWEPRQPQDFVQGVRDDQTVPEPRPRQVDSFIGPLGTTLSQNAAAGAQLIIVESTKRMMIGDTVTIMLDNGQNYETTIHDIIDFETLQISGALPWSASSGNVFIDVSAYSNPDLYTWT